MKILVTGAAGFLGSHTCERLLTSGHTVVGLDNFDNSYSKKQKHRNLEIASHHSNFKLVEGDLGDRTAMTRLLRTASFEAVVHLAGQTDLRLSVYDPVKFERGNVGQLLPFLEALRECGPRHIVAASSGAVYDAHLPLPWREDMPCMAPATPYGASARAMEIFLSTYAGLYGFKVVVLRIFTVYGSRQRAGMAAVQFARGLLTGEPITLYNNAHSSRDLTYVDDIVHGLELALIRGFTKEYNVYNLGSGHAVSTMDILRHLEALSGRKHVSEAHAMPGDISKTQADISKAHAELGYAPKVGLHDGLKHLLEWVREDLKIDPPVPTKQVHP